MIRSYSQARRQALSFPSPSLALYIPNLKLKNTSVREKLMAYPTLIINFSIVRNALDIYPFPFRIKISCCYGGCFTGDR